jgi:hypothetical protein
MKIATGGKIKGWGNPSGNLSAWLQSSTNKVNLEDKDGTALEDVSFFQATLNPVVADKKLLRCDYYVPVTDSETNEDFPVLSLFYNATKEEVKAVGKLQPEQIKATITRLLHWQTMLKQSQEVSNSITARLIETKFLPQVKQHHGSFKVAFDRESARKRGSFIYLNLRGENEIIEAKTHMNPEMTTLEDFTEGNTGFYKQEKSTDLISINTEEETVTLPSVHYLYSDDSINVTSNSFIIGPCLFDVRGNFTLTTQKLSLTKEEDQVASCFWPVGSLVFKSLKDNCPIDNIKIIAADSTYPIMVCGDLDFTENPKVNLEFLNASRIDVILRELR